MSAGVKSPAVQNRRSPVCARAPLRPAPLAPRPEPAGPFGLLALFHPCPCSPCEPLDSPVRHAFENWLRGAYLRASPGSRSRTYDGAAGYQKAAAPGRCRPAGRCRGQRLRHERRRGRLQAGAAVGGSGGRCRLPELVLAPRQPAAARRAVWPRVAVRCATRAPPTPLLPPPRPPPRRQKNREAARRVRERRTTLVNQLRTEVRAAAAAAAPLCCAAAPAA